MSNKFEEAKSDYLAGISCKQIAEKYGVAQSTVRGWKARYDWDNDKIDYLVDDDNKLSDKQKLFCSYYIQRFNASWAYHKAYNSSWPTAYANGSQLLGNTMIKTELDKLKQFNAEQLHITQLDIIRQLVKVAFADLGEYVDFGSKPAVDDNGHEYQRSYVYFKEKDEVDTTMIKEIHIGQNGPEIKLQDQIKAYELLLKSLPESHNTDITNDNAIENIITGFASLKEAKNTNGIAETESEFHKD